MDIVEKARVFATAGHAAIGQLRNYSEDPYIVHPEAAVAILETVPHTPVMKAALWMHDLVEDTQITRSLIAQEFGEDVAELVDWLSDISKPEDGNRAVRKAIDRAHSAMSPADAQTLKFCDLIHNTEDILRNDPGFATVYIPEVKQLHALLLEGDRSLWNRLGAQLYGPTWCACEFRAALEVGRSSNL